MLTMFIILIVVASVGYGTYTATSTHYQAKITLLEETHKVDMKKAIIDAIEAGYENGYQQCKIDNLYNGMAKNAEARKNQQ